jgi:hypothetical protein
VNAGDNAIGDDPPRQRVHAVAVRVARYLSLAGLANVVQLLRANRQQKTIAKKKSKKERMKTISYS